MGLLKLLGQLTMMNAETPGELATGAMVVESENEKEKRKNIESEPKETKFEWLQCSNCGAKVLPNDSYCKNCGSVFNKDAPKSNSNEHINFTFFDFNGNVIDYDNLKMYKSGFYTVGKHGLIEGEYMFFSPNCNGFLCIGAGMVKKSDLLPTDDEDESINNMFLKLKQGDSIYFNNGFLINTKLFYKFSSDCKDGCSTYRVGIDILPGDYVIYPINSEYYSGYRLSYNFMESNSHLPNIVSLDKKSNIVLKKGMVLTLFGNCNFEKTEKVVAKNDTNGEIAMDINDFFKEQTINFEVLETKTDIYTDASKGTTLYFKISNRTTKNMKIQFDNMSIVNKNREEYDYSCWLDGYNIYNTNIGAGNSKKGAVIFKDINNLDIFQFNVYINDITNNRSYSLLFSRKNNNWEFKNGEVQELDNQNKENKIVEKKIKDNIERIEPFEEEIGITLENISINITDDFDRITVLGEIISINQEKNKENFTIYVNYYNKDNEIIKKDSEFIEQFKGYDSFEILTWSDSLNIKEVEKIRIFVKE